MKSTALTPGHITSRVAASLLGAYVFVWGFTTLVTTLLVAAGMLYSQAQTLVYLLAFLVFLVAFCWTFVAASLMRVWLVLLGGGGGMTGAAWLLSRALV
jgi:hypothetical protein